MDVSRETLKMIFGEERVNEEITEIINLILKDPEGYRQKITDSYKKVGCENSQVCKECGGKCCKKAPCHWGPDDIKDLSYSGIKKFLKEKKYISVLRLPGEVCEVCFRTIDYKGEYFYILRTRTRGTGIAAVVNQIDKDDKCMLLTPEGCKISFEERPKGARLLIPDEKRNCNQLYSFDDCIFDWQGYQDVLEKVFRYFRITDMHNTIFGKK